MSGRFEWNSFNNVLIELSRIEMNEINLPTHEKKRY